MITLRSCKGETIAVFGLARSGLATVRAVVAGGGNVVAWDDNAEKRDAAQAEGATIAPFSDWDWSHIRSLALSPGVPLTHPKPHAVVEAAKTAGVEIIGDVELFLREMAQVQDRPRIVAITGTNGKSTTTALTAHLLKGAGLAVEMGGNIGRPVLDLDPPPAAKVYVLEISSYQIDLTPGLAPDVGVLLNITPDHIDRHGSLEGYARVKRRMFKKMGRSGTAVIGVDDALTAEICTAVSSNGVGKVVPISVGKALDRGVPVIDGVLFDCSTMPCAEVMDLKRCRALPGAHNWQNAAAAFGAARALTNDVQALVRALLSFPGLPHRMEDVGKVGPITCINDSKATNADAAARALACYDKIYWIAGGVPKEGGITSLQSYFPKIARAYLIGEAAPQFAKTLEGKVAHVISGDMTTALEAAARDAIAAGDKDAVVLLSPACASFDQFKDYEDRGDQFRASVARLRAKKGNGHVAA